MRVNSLKPCESHKYNDEQKKAEKVHATQSIYMQLKMKVNLQR